MTSATQNGYVRQGDGYLKRSLPPLEFQYTEVPLPANSPSTTSTPESLENLPSGLDGGSYQWIDLDGDGLAGVLTEQANAWFYKRNLSPINVVVEPDTHRRPRQASLPWNLSD